MQLLADYGRQVRVADIARTVQGEAATALTASQRSAIQVIFAASDYAVLPCIVCHNCYRFYMKRS